MLHRSQGRMATDWLHLLPVCHVQQESGMMKRVRLWNQDSWLNWFVFFLMAEFNSMTDLEVIFQSSLSLKDFSAFSVLLSFLSLIPLSTYDKPQVGETMVFPKEETTFPQRLGTGVEKMNYFRENKTHPLLLHWGWLPEDHVGKSSVILVGPRQLKLQSTPLGRSVFENFAPEKMAKAWGRERTSAVQGCSQFLLFCFIQQCVF